jgi:ATP-binding cassette subfamily F protein 3
LDEDLDIIETLISITDKMTIGSLRKLLGSFLFSGDDVFKKVGVLSGGEKSRVALAKILLTESNLIILDEPTNHLDMTSKSVLQQALIDFAGSLIIISHDIDFLRPIVNGTLEIRNHTVTQFAGGIDYYLYKKDLRTNSSDHSNKLLEKSSVEEKRIQKKREAELRQKLYSSTKKLKEQLKTIEQKIEQLEKKQKTLEDILFLPETYNDINFANEKNSELAIIKIELEKYLSKWESVSLEIQKIEKSILSDFNA